MRLRTFTAPDMPSAMQMVRAELGENAIILSSESKPGRKQVTVTAAVEEDDEEEIGMRHEAPGGKNPSGLSPHPLSLNPQALSDLRFELQNILRFHNIPEFFVAKLLQKLVDADIAEIIQKHISPLLSRGRVREGVESIPLEAIKKVLEKLLLRNFVFDPLSPTSQNFRIMLVGIAGIGKTLTIAKLATKLAMDKQPVIVITTDNTRAGGIEQLKAFTDILGLKLHVAGGREDIIKILGSIPSSMRVLVDTAGCSPYDKAEFGELEALASIEKIEPVLVLPAGGDSMEAIDMVEVFRSLPIRRVLVTRADATRRFGGIMAAVAAHGLSFSNISRSASITDKVQPLDPALLAQMLLKYKN